MGTLAGTWRRRPCWYFRDLDRADCHKRGRQLLLRGLRREQTHASSMAPRALPYRPSDTATALSALNANVLVAA
jgi:hypothetical protein